MTNTTIATPIEIRVPGADEDFGLELVHDMTGEKRNYLHQTGIADGSKAERYAIDANYHQSHGYRKDGKQFWTWTKQYPLFVEQW